MTTKQERWLAKLIEWSHFTPAQQWAVGVWLPGAQLIDALSPPPRTPNETWADFTIRGHKETYERGQRVLRAVWSFARAGDERARKAANLALQGLEAADLDGLDPSWAQRVQDEVWEHVFLEPYDIDAANFTERERRTDAQAEADMRDLEAA